MKKKFLLLVLPLFLLAFALTSCDAYAGNYKEATAEDIETVEKKLNSLAEEAEKEEDKQNYEMKLTGDLEMSLLGATTALSFDYTMLLDNVNEIMYAKMGIEANASGSNSGKLTIGYESWFSGENSYLSYSLKGSSNGVSIDKAEKLKNPSSLPAEISTYSAMISKFNTNINIEDISDMLEGSNAKVYVDGENKFKIEYTEGDSKMILYFIINSNNTYQFKVEVPKTSSEGQKVGYVLEFYPTSKNAKLPNDADYK